MVPANSSLSTISVDLELSDDARSLLNEALDAFAVSEHDMAKKRIAERLMEIRRLETCLERAKAGLAELLQKEVTVIAMQD
jgi:hypothetical protein